MKKCITKLALLFIFVSGCAIATKRGPEPVVVAEPVRQESTTTAVSPEVALKRIIVDKDLKISNEDKELKKRVVVLPFIDRKSLRDEELLRRSQLAFIDSLNANGEMLAIDSSVLKLDLKKYIKDGMYDLKGIAKASNKVGVSALLEGRIVDMRFQNEDPSLVDNSSSLKLRPVVFEVVVHARMVSYKTGQELFNTVKTVVVDDRQSNIPQNIDSANFFSKNPELTELLIKDAFMDFNIKLAQSLKLITWEGRIAALQGDRIYLNVGKISGVKVGDILKVVEDADEIYDTELGYHVGKVPGKVKGTLEIVGFFGQDGAVSVVHSGAGFRENDRVEVYH